MMFQMEDPRQQVVGMPEMVSLHILPRKKIVSQDDTAWARAWVARESAKNFLRAGEESIQLNPKPKFFCTWTHSPKCCNLEIITNYIFEV